MDLYWVPAEIRLGLAFLVVISAYLLMMRILSVLVDGRSELPDNWQEAEQKAEKLLAEILSPEEFEQVKTRGYLDIPSRRHPNRVYRIPRHAGLVGVYENDSLTNRLCVRSVDPIPSADVVLVHKLMIEGDEDQYLRLANSIRPRPYPFTL